MHIVAVAREVVASQVNQHHVFGILLRVVTQILGILAVLLSITSALGGTSDRVDVGMILVAPLLYAAVGLRRRAEDAETAEVEVEQVRTWVD